MRRAILVSLLLLTMTGFRGKGGGTLEKKEGELSLLLFIPGKLEGSASYQELARAFEKSVSSSENLVGTVVEGGFSQSRWERQLLYLAAGRNYDIIITTNSALPEICAKVGESFPSQRFVIFDAYREGNPQMTTILYNQYEQSFLLGYLAGLLVLSERGAKIGFVAAQHFSLLDQMIIPGFRRGLAAVDSEIFLDLRFLGNWYDASAAARLSEVMIQGGVGVITTIAGAADAGVYSTASREQVPMVSFNVDAYDQGYPGTVVGSGVVRIEALVEDLFAQIFTDTVPYGEARIVGIGDGYIDFLDENPGYTEHVPLHIQERFGKLLKKIRSGEMTLDTPQLR